MRLTCRFRPSRSVISIQAVATFLRNRIDTERSGNYKASTRTAEFGVRHAYSLILQTHRREVADLL